MRARSSWSAIRVSDLQAPRRYALNGGPFGSKLVSNDYVPEGVPVIRGANLPGHSRFSMNDFVFVSESKADELLPNNAHPGDLVFTQRGTLGQVGLIPRTSPFSRFVISQSQMKLTVDEKKADAAFLYYYFRAPRTVQQIHNLGFSTGVPHINLDILRNFEVRLPPLHAQKQIRAILSAYDDLIENNTRRIKILEKMAQAIYREWFVHFRFPGHKKVKLVNSPLGPIPERWSVRKLGEVVELAYGKALKAENRRKGNVPVYGSSGIVGSHDESLVSGPGVIVGRKGNVGTVHWCDGDFFPIDTVFYVQTNISLRYTYYNLQTQNFISGDAAVPGLSRTQAYSLPILVPAENVLTEFEALVESFFAAMRNLRERNENLRETRDLLLPRLISGEVDLSEVEVAGE